LTCKTQGNALVYARACFNKVNPPAAAAVSRAALGARIMKGA